MKEKAIIKINNTLLVILLLEFFLVIIHSFFPLSVHKEVVAYIFIVANAAWIALFV
jgi:hypothetical protein